MFAPFRPTQALASMAAIGMALCMGTAAPSARAADPQPISEFFRNSAVSSAAASPSGRYVALSATDGTHNRLRLMVVDLQDISKSRVLFESDDEDVIAPSWVNEDMLVYEVGDRSKAIGEKPAYGLMSIDREAKEGAKLLIRSNTADFSRADMVKSGLVLPPWYRLERVLRDGSNDIIVGEYIANRDNDDVGYVDLYRLNTRTGRTVKLTSDAPENATRWVVDAMGRPRATVAASEYKEKLYWKATPDAPWTLVREYASLHDEGRALNPRAVSLDNHLYAVGRLNPTDDTETLLRFDMSNPQSPPERVVKVDGYDFSGSLVASSNGTIKGVRYLSDARGTFWIDPALKKIQEDVDRKLPGLSNTVDCGSCDDPKTVLVTSSSDRQPMLVSMFDSVAGKLTVLTQSRPWIKARTMARQDRDRVTARDGLVFPVLVTHPPGIQGAAPTVVLVHGGPYVPGIEWGWNPFSQFLASRGYLVIEPDYRGTTGFGSKLFHAGWKQWGLAMQDDIADATTWAVQKGYADPKRICIAGASYGGYATLMGLIRYPDLYRCGFEWVGVSDIDLMYTIAWSDFDSSYKTYGMPVLVGDQVKDAVQLANTSPVKRAAELKQPLLMAYGGRDVRVPIDHGTAMRNALKKTNQNVEWVEYPLEGHGWIRDDSNADWWARVERFLDKNLKNAP